MDFDLTDDQQALRDGAAELLAGYASAEQVRAHTDSGDPYDERLWNAMVEQGWLAVDVSERDGGLGFGAVEAGVLAEAVGRSVAPVPYLATILAAFALREAGDDRAEALRSGEAIGCVGWAPGGLTATEAGGRWLLSGRSDPCEGAPIASLAVVVATDTDGEPGVYALDLEVDERPPAEPAMDLTATLGWLRFDQTEAVRLGDNSLATALFDRAVALTSMAMLGTADRVLEMATDYAKQREQFGRPIGSFQAVKHRCADMLVDVEGMRSVALCAVWAVGADQDASVAASTAKTWCFDASRRVMASGLQVHGGIGFTWEHDLHFLLKRAQRDQVAYGDATYHRRRLTELLRPRVDAGGVV